MKKKKPQGIEVPNIVIYIAKSVQFISKDLATTLCSRLFITPIKHKTPKRETAMLNTSKKEWLEVPKINKKVMVYQYGDSPKKVLLVHGWSGRGTQLYKIADALLKQGYATISYDAPAHGQSGTKTTLMPEFIATNFELEKKFGPFEFAVGHSLGGMSLLNSVKRGLNLKKMVVIGSADRIIDIMHMFVKTLKLKPIIAENMQDRFQKKFGEPLHNYDSANAAKEVEIPTLVIHDKDDYEVPIQCGIEIHKALKQGDFYETKRLGHRKILGDEKVIEKIISYLQE